jgi:hypothetical protein
MSISSTNRKAGPYSCNGSTTQFPFVFKVFSASDVRVIRTNLAGVESDLVLGTDYTVTLNADQDANPGGTVTTTTAPAAGYLITITSRVQNLQPITLTNQGGFYPKVINDALDRLTILVQQNAEQVSRAVKVNISSSTTPDQLIDQLNQNAANAAASANSAANSAASAASSAGNAANSAATAAAYASSIPADVQKQTHVRAVTSGTSTAFTAAPTPAITANTAGTRLRLTFHTAVGASATLAVSGLTALPLKCKAGAALVNAPVGMVLGTQDVECDGTNWVVQKDVSVLNVKDFGAVGDGTTDDKAAIQSAINAAVAASGGIVFFPTGNYAVASGLTVSGSHVRLVGGAVGAASITATANGFIVLDVTGTRHSLENLLVYRNLFSSNPSDVLVRLNNAVQCKIDNCWLQGGFYSLAITGTNCTDNVITCSTLTFATGSALVLMQSSGGINGAHHFYRVLCNQAYPAGVPVAANYKGAWSASTAYAVKDVVTVGAYYLQCTVAGTSGNVAPAVNAFYGTNIPDNTVTWQLMGRADYRGFQIDTGVTFVRIRECDVTGPYVNGINLTNTLSGSAPQAITIERCTIHGPVFNGVFVNAGKEIELLGVNTFSPTGGGTTLYGIGLAGSEQALVKDCQVYGYTQGIYTNTPRTSIIGNAVFGCNVGIYVEANLSSFAIVGNLCGSSSVRGGNTIGIQVAAGTSDRYVITNNITFGATTGVSDGGSGVNKSVTQNF